MKASNLIFITLFIFGLFTACEQDQTMNELATLDPNPSTTQAFTETDERTEIATVELETAVILDSTTIEAAEIESRSNRTRIYSKHLRVRAGYAYPIRHARNNLDPYCRYTVEVRRYDGDPDLFIYGGNSQRATRKIRRAEILENGRLEKSYFVRMDLAPDEYYGYYLIYADKGVDAEFKVEIFKECDNDGDNSDGCSNVPDDCQKVSCTPVLFNNDGTYGCTINASFLDDYQVEYWTVNGQRQTRTGNEVKLTVLAPGDYEVCAYFLCNGELYKCCQVVTCPPVDNGNDHCHTILKEGFEDYRAWDKIAQVSHEWVTWDRGREGSNQDAVVMNDAWQGGRKYLHLSEDRAQDVVYRLGNQNSGCYELSFELFMIDAGYFNIQEDQYNFVGGGLFGVKFFGNGRYEVRTNGGGRSSLIGYSIDRWIDISMSIDLDRNQYELTIEGRTFQLTSVRGFDTLGGINFFAPDNASFHVDNIELKICN
ncbi:MAG: hypothetical protein AAGI23_03670 [Bacteroidota bacterium]